MNDTSSTMKPSTKELMEAIHQAVLDTPSLRSRFNAVVQFHVTDDNRSGAVEDGTINISKSNKKGNDNNTQNRPHTKQPDLIVTTSLDVFHSLLNKQLTPQQAFMQGKLKVKGKMSLAMKLTLVLNATRKELLQNKKKQNQSSDDGRGRVPPHLPSKL